MSSLRQHIQIMTLSYGVSAYAYKMLLISLKEFRISQFGVPACIYLDFPGSVAFSLCHVNIDLYWC